MEDERMLPEEREDRIGDVVNRQINAGIEDIFRDHPDEAGFAICMAGTTLFGVGAFLFGRRVFKKPA